MTATTITADVGDLKPGVGLPAFSVSAGGTPGARGVTVILDWAKIGATGGLLDVVNTLERITQVVREQGVALPKS